MKHYYYLLFPLFQSSFRQFLFSSHWIISTLVARFPYPTSHLPVCNVNAGNCASCFFFFFFFLFLQAFKEMLYSAQDQAPSIEGKYQSLCIRYQREFYRIALHPSNDEFRGISNTNRGIKTSWTPPQIWTNITPIENTQNSWKGWKSTNH